MSDELSNNVQTKNKKQSNWREPWTIVLVVIVVIAVGGAGYYYSNSKKNNSTPVATSQTVTATTTPTAITQTPKIYYAQNNNLYSIDPTSKQTAEIDTKAASTGGTTGLGSNTPLTSFDQLKVVYAKDGSIWLKQDGQTAKKLYQSTSSDPNCYNSFYFSGWSSDSKNLVYDISFDSGMGEATCSQSDADKDAEGFYWYSLDSQKSTKLPITRADLLVPQSNKVAYFEKTNNAYQLKTYDFVAKTSETLSKNGWTGYEPQLAFSNDASKIIYSYGETASSSYSKIVIADINNTNQKIEKQGRWAEYQFPRFMKGSTSNYYYDYNKERTCASGSGGCPEITLHSVINGTDSEVVGIIDRVNATMTDGTLVIKKGDIYDSDHKRTISVVDLNSKSVTDLLEGNETLNFSIGW